MVKKEESKELRGRVGRLEARLELQEGMKVALKATWKTADEILSLYLEGLLAAELVRKWVGLEKSVQKFCLALSQYAEDLREPMAELALHMKVAAKIREIKPDWNPAHKGEREKGEEPTRLTLNSEAEVGKSVQGGQVQPEERQPEQTTQLPPLRVDRPWFLMNC